MEPAALEAAFLAGLPEEAGAELGGGRGLRERLAALAARARTAHPGPSVDLAAFVGFLAGHLPAGIDPMEALAALHVEDLYLAFACAQGDLLAIAELERVHVPELRRVLERMQLTASEIDESIQLVRELLLVGGASGRPAVLHFSGLGALGRWLRVVTVREALRLVRRMRRDAAADDGLLLQAAASDDPQIRYFKATYRAEFKAAFTDALASLSPRDKNLLRYHYVESLSPGAIGLIFRAHRTTVARWLIQVRSDLLATTRRLLGERLNLSAGEIESVIRLIHSQLDLSLPRLLGETD